MDKITFFIKRKLSFLFSVFLLVYFITACNFSPDSFEELYFSFEQWPPQNSSFTYPELYKWKVNIQCANYSEEFFTSEKGISVKCKKNVPLSITACPITFYDEDSLFCFFKPCGAFYPYSKGSQEGYIGLSWAEGFGAQLANGLYEGAQASKLSSNQIDAFISSFNWKKLFENLSQKEEKSYLAIKNGFSSSFYNPWHLQKDKLYEKISYKNFSSTNLNISSVQNLNLTELQDYYKINLNSNFKFDEIFSSYIPENIIIQEHKTLSFASNEAELFLCNKKYGLVIDTQNPNFFSSHIVFMPIINNGYE